MDFSKSLFIVFLAYGLITIAAGFLMLKKTPKKINNFYGYRTRQSMSSKEKWNFAQNYSSKEMIRQDFAFLGIGIISLFTSFNEIANMIFAMFLIIGSVILLLYRTEKKIKTKIQKNETIQRNSEI